MRIIRLSILLLVVLVGVVFAGLNAEPVSLNYYYGSIEVPLALILSAALLIGAIAGIIVSVGASLRLRRELASLRRRYRQDREELDNLRSLPVKE